MTPDTLRQIARAAAALLFLLGVVALTGCAEDPFDRIADQLDGRNIQDRTAAIRELRYMRDERSIDGLVQALEDQQVVYEAAEALVYKGRLTKTPKKDDPVIEAVTREMQAAHLEAPTRAAAAWVLGQIGDREAIPALKGAAGDATLLIAANAKDALKQLGYYATAPVPLYIVNRSPFPTGKAASTPKALMATITAVEISGDGIGWTMAAPLLAPKKVDFASTDTRAGDGILLTTDTALIAAGNFTWLRIHFGELWATDDLKGARSFLVEKVPEDAVVTTPDPMQPLVLAPKDYAGLSVPATWPPNGRLVLNVWLDQVVAKTSTGYELKGLPKASLTYVGDVGRGNLAGTVRDLGAAAVRTYAVSPRTSTTCRARAGRIAIPPATVFPTYSTAIGNDGAFASTSLSRAATW